MALTSTVPSQSTIILPDIILEYFKRLFYCDYENYLQVLKIINLFFSTLLKFLLFSGAKRPRSIYKAMIIMITFFMYFCILVLKAHRHLFLLKARITLKVLFLHVPLLYTSLSYYVIIQLTSIIHSYTYVGFQHQQEFWFINLDITTLYNVHHTISFTELNRLK